MSFISVNSCPHATGKSDCTHCNNYTEYDSKPPYPVQKYHLCHIGKGIMPYGNSSVVCQGIFRAELPRQRWKYPQYAKDQPLETRLELLNNLSFASM